MKAKDHLPGHLAVIDRRDVGARHHGGYHRYYTTVGCSCGWAGREIQIAPTAGGRSKAVIAHRHHVVDLISRDPLATVMRARTEWRDWQPGDSTCYRVRIITIQGGPDYNDRVLLVTIAGNTYAFQYPVAPYRKAQASTSARRRDLARNIPPDIWGAAMPLLVAEGAI